MSYRTALFLVLGFASLLLLDARPRTAHAGGDAARLPLAEVRGRIDRDYSDLDALYKHQHVLEGIERIAKAAAAAGRATEPTVRVDPGEFTPAMLNDVSLTRRTAGALKAALGDENVQPKPPVMGGEDFSRYGRAGVPICMFRLGTSPPDLVSEAVRGGRQLPSLHSDVYYPIPEPSIKTGVLAMTTAVLNLMGK